ncbi:acyl-CoA dehydratase activase [Maridesulfovibrio bastinii]|uniref:acyl-CoA dehydratase activase n=1 Tax=Maridesulfovibrio bastinii TaxID=47157 RepID=UPI00041F77D8|nr:acyl-CoA dehydratase activase [Maridesulfovibrio bastinii]
MVAGIDIGSRSIEYLVVDDEGNIVNSIKTATTFTPLQQCQKIFESEKPEKIVATGYGRKLILNSKIIENIHAITEIKAYALGIAKIFPQAKTILDIGGQDTKAISLLANGKVSKFEMNDRCAAGTGKFLEFLATAFQIPIEDFGAYALNGTEALPISNMCTVFAESEAVSLLAQGKPAENIALGLHASIVNRTINMLKRVGLEFPLVFAGGVAHNPCVRTLLENSLKEEILIPEHPDVMGAYGAALYGLTAD